MIDDFNKRQRVIDLGEEAEDEILESTGKTESTFDTPQYRRVMAACKERESFLLAFQMMTIQIHPLAVEGGVNLWSVCTKKN